MALLGTQTTNFQNANPVATLAVVSYPPKAVPALAGSSSFFANAFAYNYPSKVFTAPDDLNGGQARSRSMVVFDYPLEGIYSREEVNAFHAPIVPPISVIVPVAGLKLGAILPSFIDQIIVAPASAGLQLGANSPALIVSFDTLLQAPVAGLRLQAITPIYKITSTVFAPSGTLLLVGAKPGFVGQSFLFADVCTDLPLTIPVCLELTLPHYGSGGVPPVVETIEDAIRVPDLTLYYRMGNAFVFPPDTGVGSVGSGGVLADTAGFATLSPGVPRPGNLSYFERQGAPGWTAANRPTLAASHDVSGDDGAVQFNYDQKDWYISSKAGCAFAGDVPSYVPSIGSIALANFGTTYDHAQAFSVFFKPQKTTGAPGTYLDYQSLICGTWAMDISGSANEGWGLVFRHNSMTLSWNLNLAPSGPTNFFQLVAPAPLEDDRWYHAAGTWDGTVYRLYLDGVEVASLAETRAPGSPHGNLSNFFIGYGDFDFGVTNTDGFFFGSIDEVAIYSRPLSALEIQHISDVGRGPFPAIEETIEDAIRVPDLTLYYRVGESFAQGDVVVGAMADTAGYAVTPRNLNYLEASTVPGWIAGNRPTLDVSHPEVVGDDGALQFNFDQESFHPGGQFPGVALAGDTRDGTPPKALCQFKTADPYAQTFSCFFKGRHTAGTAYRGLVCGNAGHDFSFGTYGWGLFFDHLDLTVHWNVFNFGVDPYLWLDLVFQCEADRWYHAAGTWDGFTYRLFIDGSEVASFASTVPAADIGFGEPGIFRIGKTTMGIGLGECDNYFFGSVDEVAIYSRPLSVLEIQHISDAGHAGGATPPDPLELTCIELELEPALCR